MKLQVLNLAVKLYLTNPIQTEMLCQYVFSLARFDQNYDIRDRARFLKQFIFPADGQPTVLSKNARKIFLAAKPAPLLESKYQGREQFQLGSLSHYLNIRATGYHDLPMFPEVAPDSSVRNVELANEPAVEPTEHKGIASSSRSGEKEKSGAKSGAKSEKKAKSFYSDSEKSSEYSDDDDEIEDESDESARGSDESGAEESASEKGKSSSGEDEETSGSEDDSSSSDDDDTSESSSESDKESKPSTSNTQKPSLQSGNSSKKSAAVSSERGNLDLLLDLDDIGPSGPVMTPSLGGFLSPLAANSVPMVGAGAASATSKYELVGPSFIPSKQELLNKINGHGLQVNYRFTRGPHLYSAKMVSIELTLKNESQKELENIRISNKSLPAGMDMNEFPPIAKLNAGQIVSVIIGIDFNDSTQAANFIIESSGGSSKVTLRASLGESIRSVSIPEATYRQEQSQLRGMNEHSGRIETSISKLAAIRTKILEVVNVAAVNRAEATDDELLLFAGQTMASKSLVLISVERQGDKNSVFVTVNCEKMVVGSMLLNEIKTVLKN